MAPKKENSRLEEEKAAVSESETSEIESYGRIMDWLFKDKFLTYHWRCLKFFEKKLLCHIFTRDFFSHPKVWITNSNAAETHSVLAGEATSTS